MTEPTDAARKPATCHKAGTPAAIAPAERRPLFDLPQPPAAQTRDGAEQSSESTAINLEAAHGETDETAREQAKPELQQRLSGPALRRIVQRRGGAIWAEALLLLCQIVAVLWLVILPISGWLSQNLTTKLGGGLLITALPLSLVLAHLLLRARLSRLAGALLAAPPQIDGQPLRDFLTLDLSLRRAAQAARLDWQAGSTRDRLGDAILYGLPSAILCAAFGLIALELEAHRLALICAIAAGTVLLICHLPQHPRADDAPPSLATRFAWICTFGAVMGMAGIELSPRLTRPTQPDTASPEPASLSASPPSPAEEGAKESDKESTEPGAFTPNYPSLANADLKGADFTGAQLSQTDLSGADLSGALLQGAWLDQADLSGARLIGAQLSQARMSDARLPAAQLDQADLSWSTLLRADLSGASLRAADLSGVDLTDAQLDGADLAGAVLREADFAQASLVGANLSGADLRESWNLTQAQVAQTQGDGATQLPQGLHAPAHWQR
ncbi:MAG: pentapeptide repeat-containing protein [Neomegalonema sp.]|nr:pentapeptide repeat-containing protein [Neomegalonema sp.]